MKRIKFLSLLAFAAFVAVSFNACKGDDGDDSNEYNDEEWVEYGDSLKYSVAYTNLDDNGTDLLSFKHKITFVLPENATIEYLYNFKYEALSVETETDSLPDDVAADSVSTDSVVEVPTETSDASEADKSDYPIVEASIVVDCSSNELAQEVYEMMKADSLYNVSIDGSKIMCEYTKAYLEGITYASVAEIYAQITNNNDVFVLDTTTVADTLQPVEPIKPQVIDSTNSVIADNILCRIKCGYYSISDTAVQFHFTNYSIGRNASKPNDLVIIVPIDKNVKSVSEVIADTIANVRMSFVGNSPSKINKNGTGSILVQENGDKYSFKTVGVSDFIFNYSGTLTEEFVKEVKTDDNGVKSKVEESNGNLVLTIDTDVCQTTYTASFENGKCNGCVQKQKYTSEAYAKLVYDNSGSNKSKRELAGDTITIDITDEYKGMSKEDVKRAFEALAAAYKS